MENKNEKPSSLKVKSALPFGFYSSLPNSGRIGFTPATYPDIFANGPDKIDLHGDYRR